MTDYIDSLVYTRTNESLPSIEAGLEINSSDRVFMCCGSGDAIFLSLALASHVKGVDINRYQITYTSERVQALKNKDYTKFFGLDSLGNGYDRYLNEQNILHLLGTRKHSINEVNFSQEYPRVDSMRENLPNLSLETNDFFESLSRDAEKYNKIFTSNIFTMASHKTMKKIIDKLQIGTLIYTSGNLSFCTIGIKMYGRISKKNASR